MSWGMFGGILTIIGKAASVGVAKTIAACCAGSIKFAFNAAHAFAVSKDGAGS